MREREREAQRDGEREDVKGGGEGEIETPALSTQS